MFILFSFIIYASSVLNRISGVPPMVYMMPNTRVEPPKYFPCPWTKYALVTNSNGGLKPDNPKYDSRPLCANGDYDEAISNPCPYEGLDACACPYGLVCCYPKGGPHSSRSRFCAERKKVILEEKVVLGCLQRIGEQSGGSQSNETLAAGKLCYYMRQDNIEYKTPKPCGPGLHCCYSKEESLKYEGGGYAWTCKRGFSEPFYLSPMGRLAYEALQTEPETTTTLGPSTTRHGTIGDRDKRPEPDFDTKVFPIIVVDTKPKPLPNKTAGSTTGSSSEAPTVSPSLSSSLSTEAPRQNTTSEPVQTTRSNVNDAGTSSPMHTQPSTAVSGVSEQPTTSSGTAERTSTTQASAVTAHKAGAVDQQPEGSSGSSQGSMHGQSGTATTSVSHSESSMAPIPASPAAGSVPISTAGSTPAMPASSAASSVPVPVVVPGGPEEEAKDKSTRKITTTASSVPAPEVAPDGPGKDAKSKSTSGIATTASSVPVPVVVPDGPGKDAKAKSTSEITTTASSEPVPVVVPDGPGKDAKSKSTSGIATTASSVPVPVVVPDGPGEDAKAKSTHRIPTAASVLDSLIDHRTTSQEGPKSSENPSGSGVDTHVALSSKTFSVFRHASNVLALLNQLRCGLGKTVSSAITPDQTTASSLRPGRHGTTSPSDTYSSTESSTLSPLASSHMSSSSTPAPVGLTLATTTRDTTTTTTTDTGSPLGVIPHPVLINPVDLLRSSADVIAAIASMPCENEDATTTDSGEHDKDNMAIKKHKDATPVNTARDVYLHSSEVLTSLIAAQCDMLDRAEERGGQERLREAMFLEASAEIMVRIVARPCELLKEARRR